MCLNGHLITTFFHTHPDHNKNFCDKCGAKTISACLKCQTEIRGHYYQPGVADLSRPGPPPSFCHNCGNPHPWTERRLTAAREVAEDADQLDDAEKQGLKDSVDELVHNTPAAPSAVIKYKKFVAKAGRQVGEGLRSILIDVVSETIKKQIWP